MKTAAEAIAIAQKWEAEKATGPAALVGRALLAHINSLASPQVTDEQIVADALEMFGRHREFSNCFDDINERGIVDFVRRYISAPPAAETPKSFLAQWTDVIMDGSQEAKPVAAELDDIKIGRLIAAATGNRINLRDTEIAEFYALAHMVASYADFAAAPQEQAPAEKDASPKFSGFTVKQLSQMREAISQSMCPAPCKMIFLDGWNVVLGAIDDAIAEQSQPQQVTHG